MRTLVDESLDGGAHRTIWDGRDASDREIGSGSYLARLKFNGSVDVVKMVLVR